MNYLGRFCTFKIPQYALAICLAVLVPSMANGERILTRAELDAILQGGQEYLEDFEQVSLHDGTVIWVPNPFNYITGAPFGWGGLNPGVSYRSDNYLQMRAQGTNILEGRTDVTIEFDEPQLAVGFTSYRHFTSNFHQTITFYNGNDVIGTLEFTNTAFVGWKDIVVGITSIRIESTGSSSAVFSRIDDIAWGRNVLPPVPPIDVAVMRGFHQSGNLIDLWTSDDTYMSFSAGVPFHITDPNVWLEFESAISTDEPLTLTFLLESKANTIGVVETIELFNFDSHSYETFNVDPVSTSDSTIVIDIGGDVRPYVESDTTIVRARIAWIEQGYPFLFPWTISLDQVAWLYTTE